MDWMWVMRKKEEATSPSRPGLSNARLGPVQAEGRFVLEQRCLPVCPFITADTRGAFQGFFPNHPLSVKF